MINKGIRMATSELETKRNSVGPTNFPSLTCLFVEHDLILKLLALFQGVVNAKDDAFAGFGSVKEFAGTALLHDLRTGESCELTEAIRAVNDGEALRHLSIGQDEVTVCRK